MRVPVRCTGVPARILSEVRIAVWTQSPHTLTGMLRVRRRPSGAVKLRASEQANSFASEAGAPHEKHQLGDKIG